MPSLANESELVCFFLSWNCKWFTDAIFTVGRTGSGKSTLTLALLRCIFTEGTVIYDGIDTKNTNLDALRLNITIIPQVVSTYA